jgi:hypothetical protein
MRSPRFHDSPAQRGAVTDVAPFDPEQIVRALARHGVAYVMIGALAARLQGFPRVTADIDITPQRDATNLDRLASALSELEARVFTEGVPEGLAFDCSAATLARADMWNLVTRAGRIDVVFRPAGTKGYDELQLSAIPFEIFGADVAVASLEDIIRSKVAAGRPQDRQDVPILRALLAQQIP